MRRNWKRCSNLLEKLFRLNWASTRKGRVEGLVLLNMNIQLKLFKPSVSFTLFWIFLRIHICLNLVLFGHSFLGKLNTGHLLTSPDSIIKQCLNPFWCTILQYWKKFISHSHGNTTYGQFLYRVLLDCCLYHYHQLHFFSFFSSSSYPITLS